MDPNDRIIDDCTDSLFADMPSEHRLGFFTESSLDLKPAYDDVIAMLNACVAADEPYVDDEGYVWQILNHTIDDEHRRVAWVEWREKERGSITCDNYYLKARDGIGSLLLWEIETYNPYFGCRVHFLQWIEDAVILIYADKHDTYAVRLQQGSEARRVEIAHAWTIQGNVLHSHATPGQQSASLQLPSLVECR